MISDFHIDVCTEAPEFFTGPSQQPSLTEKLSCCVGPQIHTRTPVSLVSELRIWNYRGAITNTIRSGDTK